MYNSYPTASYFLDVKHRESIDSSLFWLWLVLHPLSGPLSVIRVDATPGFPSLCHNSTALLWKSVEAKSWTRILWQRNASLNLLISFSIFVPRVMQSLLSPWLWQQPASTLISITEDCLPVRCSFNASNSPMHRSLFLTSKLFDSSTWLGNHLASVTSKAPGCCSYPPIPIQVGNLVYITSDGSKLHACNCYLVVSIDDHWCKVCKFTGSKLCSNSIVSNCLNVIEFLT